MPTRLDATGGDFEAAFTALVETKRGTAEDVEATVRGIIDQVRRDGDAALTELTRRFDGIDLDREGLRIGEDAIERAVAGCDPETREALELAHSRIEAHQRRLLPQDDRHTDDLGVELRSRWRPVSSAGLYVPGGSAAYPSSVLMNAVPAKVAGVERVVMTVPTPEGVFNPLVLVAAHLAGVDEIYRVGGAQAVAALAYGTKTIAPVSAIVGPGNAYVAAAKRLVFGQVGIDMIAGPSEILIVADQDNDPAWIAADLLSQAEHDALAQSVLVTDDAGLAEAVEKAVDVQLKTLPRAGTAAASWRDHGAIILVPDLSAAPPLVDRLAPEHLSLSVADPEPLLDAVHHAGAIFLGRHTPEVIGDYVGGSNHVLPTARTARFSSGLSVRDFMKCSSVLRCDAEGLRALGPAAVTLARAEGLEAHARAVTIRLNL